MTEHAVSVAEASAQILACVERMPIEQAPLASALGTVVAETVTARTNVPPWRGASMDGYAVRACDMATVPCLLRVVVPPQTVATAAPSYRITAGQAARVSTGGPVPHGADTVVRMEDTDGGATSVTIRNGRDAGMNVRPIGEDFREGDILLTAGDRMGAAAIGVLASAGIATVATYRPPTVAIISSGDDLVRLDGFDTVSHERRTVSSNSHSLPAMVRDAGARPRDGGVTPDNPLALRKAMEGAMACDLLITCGGMSVGDCDLTRTVMREMDADIKFWRVRVRPGSAVSFALIDGRPWIGLPGNPVSAFVAFELFVRPAILKMMGENLVFPTAQTVTLDESITASGEFTHFLRVIITQHDDGALHARLTGTQSSGALTSMVRANGLLMTPDGRREFKPGDRLRAIPLGNSLFRSSAFPE